MSRPVSGAVKTYLVRVKKENGIIYVYERKRRYDPEVGYTRTFDSHLLGKIMPGTDEIVSTRPRRKPTQDSGENKPAAVEEVTWGHAGVTNILERVGKESGIDDDIRRSLDEGRAQKSSLLPVTSRPIPIKPCRACQNGNARILHLVQRN